LFVSNECINRFSYEAAIGDRVFETRKLRANRIHRPKKSVYCDGCMDVKNVRKCVRRAKSCCAGAMSVLDEHRSGQPISVTRDKSPCRVDAMIQENRRIKQRDFLLKLSISQERVHHIIETLKYRNFAPGVSLDN